jgi:hypothetical protein
VLKALVAAVATASALVGFVKLYFSHKELKVLAGGGVGEGVAVGVGVGVGVGFAAATTLTPLFHTNFLPLFTQVYLMPLTVDIAPAFEQTAPAFAAAADAWSGEIVKASTANAAKALRIPRE